MTTGEDPVSSVALDGDALRDVDGDEEVDKPSLHSRDEKTRVVGEVRRREQAAFLQWLSESQRDGIQQAGSTRQESRNKGLSVAQPMPVTDSLRIIASPREYQVELFERAKQRNVIIVLETGSGKTLIAALLLRHMLDQELEKRARGEAKRVAFFVVEKVALCYQQYGVLRANLEHPMAKLHGDMTGLMRSKEFWDEQLTKNLLLVCTAQVLLDCLSNGFLDIAQINMFVFDEAHHAKKSHPFARIVKEHYLRAPTQLRPRILGMTASPVDVQTRDLRAAALELESMLCSEIATVSDAMLASSHVRPQQVEIREFYSRLDTPQSARTKLWEMLARIFADDDWHHSHLEASQFIASSLGSWCSDRYWQLLMTDAEIQSITARARAAEEDVGPDVNGCTEADRLESRLREAQGVIEEQMTLRLASQGRSINSKEFSSKFKVLKQILQEAFARKQTPGCIVFVQHRYATRLLVDALHLAENAIPGMRPAFLVGSQPISSSVINMSLRDQNTALQRFRRGVTNCIFTTQVAEEGIDIPECDLVVRFDLYDSAIQYIQSKGRARKAQSTYISMLEEGNIQHLRRLKQAKRDANALRQFCSALPADRKLQDEDDIYFTAITERERINEKVHEIEESGARLTFASSREVLAKFISSLSPSSTAVNADYIVTTSYNRKKFTATVILPETSPIRSVEGYPQRNKQLARCSAAFEACVILIKRKYINRHLQPTFSRRLPAMRQARLGLTSDRKQEYDMRSRSILLSIPADGQSTVFFRTLLEVDDPAAVGRSTSPLMLVTRFSLPQMDRIQLFFGPARTSFVRVLPHADAIQLTSKEVEALLAFTLTIFDDVFSKSFDAKSSELPFFLAPTCARGPLPQDGERTDIDWDRLLAVPSAIPRWNDVPTEFLEGRLLIDPWDGSRKFIVRGLNENLRPNDPVPVEAPLPKSRAYRLVEPTIMEYSNSLSIQFRRRQLWDQNQRVFDANLLPLRRNFLVHFDDAESQDRPCCIILEPLRISQLSVGIVSMALFVPVILHRLDSALIAQEACEHLYLQIPVDLALEALSKETSNLSEVESFRMYPEITQNPDYERLEVLGDAFLKMATSISLFTQIPSGTEFEYHVERMCMVCNQNLLNHALSQQLQEFIRSRPFDRRAWYPDLQLKRGKLPKAVNKHNLSNKTIADVCEALIGAAYLSSKDSGNIDLAVKAVSKMVRSHYHKMMKYEDYFAAFQMPEWRKRPALAAYRAAADRIHSITGYRFQCANLLRSAFKHASYTFEPVPNYQRLEFLGDALLDLAAVEFLFKRFPHQDPQGLTEYKMAIVSNHFFGALCVSLGLHRHLLTTSSQVLGQVAGFAADLEQAEKEAQLEADKIGEPIRRNYWLGTRQPPKVLSDILEAFVGAMFEDSQYDFSVVETFFGTFVQPYFEDMTLYDSYASGNPVTLLTHLLQKDFGCQKWKLYVSIVPRGVEHGAAALTEEEVVCALMIHERVIEHSLARNGREAKLAVAKKFLERLQDMRQLSFSAEMGCDCRETSY